MAKARRSVHWRGRPREGAHQLAVSVGDVSGILVAQSSDDITWTALESCQGQFFACLAYIIMVQRQSPALILMCEVPSTDQEGWTTRSASVSCTILARSPSADRLLLMACVSFRRSPLAPDDFSRSLPARSIKFSTPGRAHDCQANHKPLQV